MSAKPVYTREQADDYVRRVLARERERSARRGLEIGARHEPVPHLNTTALLGAPGLLDQFAIVPADFYANEGGTAVIACPCGWADPEDEAMRQHRIEPGGLIECPGCLRIYFMGEQLRAAAGPDCDAPRIEHTHPPEVPCLPPCPEYGP